MTSRVTKRVRYFIGKFLKKKDFEEEQDYHLDNKRSKNRTVKRPGVAKANIKRSSAEKANTKSTSVKKKTDD